MEPVKKNNETQLNSNQKSAESHKKIAEHLEVAAKHHIEAAEHHGAGNHEKAAQSTVAAHGQLNLAAEVHHENMKRYAQTN